MFISHLTARCSGHNITSYLPNVDAVWNKGGKHWNSVQYKCSCWDAAVSLPWAAVKAVPTHLIMQQQSATAIKVLLFCGMNSANYLQRSFACMANMQQWLRQEGSFNPSSMGRQAELEVVQEGASLCWGRKREASIRSGWAESMECFSVMGWWEIKALGSRIRTEMTEGSVTSKPDLLLNFGLPSWPEADQLWSNVHVIIQHRGKYPHI